MINLHKFCAASVLLLSGFAASAIVQSQPQVQSATHDQTFAAPNDKIKKVWTDDDLVRLRKPSDVQREQEIASKKLLAEVPSKSAPPAATTNSIGSVPKLADNSPMSKTVENTQAKIQAVQEEILQIQSDLQQTKQAYLNATDIPKHTKLENDVELEESDLQDRQDDLKTLQVWLESLRSTNAQTPSQGTSASARNLQ